MVDELQGITFQDSAWWLAEKRGHQPHEWLWPTIERMKSRQQTRYDNWRKLIAVFEWGFRAGDFCETSDVPLQEYVLAFNAAQNVIETLHAQLNEATVGVLPITTGGGYAARKRAQALGQALDGEFAENHLDEVQEDVTMDGFVLGSGVSKVFREWGRVKIEHVPTEDFLVDEAEGRLRRPRSLYQRMYVDRYVLVEKLGRDAPGLYGTAQLRREKILGASTKTLRGVEMSDSELIEVWEAWHLPSKPANDTLASTEEPEDDEADDGEEDTDGAHAIIIADCTLLSEPWRRSRFPISVFTPRKRRRAFWGLSEMHVLSSQQREYEKVTEKIQQAHQRMGGTHILAHKDSGVTERDMDNGQGTLVEWDGQHPPQTFNPEPVNAQTYQYQQSIPDTMLRTRGVPPMAASGQVPAGLSQASGKALQLFADEGKGRRGGDTRALERWKLDTAQLVIEEARLLVAEDPSYATRYRSQKAIENVEWKKVLLDEDDFVLTVPPVSNLAKTPAAKFAQLSQMLSAGAINVETFRRLFGLPDMEAENDLETADTDIVDKNLEIIALTGRYLSPQPFDDLALAIRRAGKFYNLCRQQEGFPETHLDLLQQYMSDAKELQAQAKAGAAAPPGAPMPPPGAAAPGPAPINAGAPPMAPPVAA